MTVVNPCALDTESISPSVEFVAVVESSRLTSHHAVTRSGRLARDAAMPRAPIEPAMTALSICNASITDDPAQS
jgi:hypothetical protein